MTPVLELSRDDDVVRELLAPYARVQPVTLKRRPARRWKRRFALVAVALALTGVIATVAVAGTGWLVGSPAPPDVKSDFGSYATQLGFNPQPGQAVLVASSGPYQLYATANTQGGFCTLVVTPWRPASAHEGGECTAAQGLPESSKFYASTGGQSPLADNASTAVVYGHTTDAGASSVQFDGPNGAPVTATVGKGGFFIVGTTVTGGMGCGSGTWAPTFHVLNATGRQMSAWTVTLVTHTKLVSQPWGGKICEAVTAGPGASPPIQPTK
jgi:hypothetical protein